MDSYKDVEYRQLERPSSNLEARRLKRIVIILSVVCVGLLCCAIYAIGYLEWKWSKNTAEVTTVSGQSGSGAQGNDEHVTTLAEHPAKGKKTDTDQKSTHGGGSLSHHRKKTPKKTSTKIEEVASHINKVSHHSLNREVLVKRLSEVIENLRTGKEDRLSMQVSMLFLQNAIQHLDRKGTTKHGGLSPTHTSKQTLNNPVVRSMMEALTLSPHDLDIFNFTKHPQIDFRCVLLKLHLMPDPLVCINDPTKDASVSRSLANSGMWEADMLKYFMSLLKVNRHLQAVDLGSNLGVYSLAAASLNRPVLAVESNIRNILPFYKSVKINSFEKLITLVTNSISDHFKLVQLINDEHNLGHTDVVDITEFMLRNDVIHAEDVSRTVTLNDLIPAMASKMAVLKVDMQGDEAKVFRSASTFFTTIDVRYVIMHWRHSRDPRGHTQMVTFFKKRRYNPHNPLSAKLVSATELRMDHPVIIWIKQTASG